MTQDGKGQSKVFYTSDYEWVAFAGGLAYTGVCQFKLTGFKTIHDINIVAQYGPIKQGALLATIRYNDYLIKAHMPVDGSILRLNDELITNGYGLLLEEPEGKGWIAEFIPNNRENTKGLSPILPYSICYKSTTPVNRIS